MIVKAPSTTASTPCMPIPCPIGEPSSVGVPAVGAPWGEPSRPTRHGVGCGFRPWRLPLVASRGRLVSRTFAAIFVHNAKDQAWLRASAPFGARCAVPCESAQRGLEVFRIVSFQARKVPLGRPEVYSTSVLVKCLCSCVWVRGARSCVIGFHEHVGKKPETFLCVLESDQRNVIGIKERCVRGANCPASAEVVTAHLEYDP